MRFAQNSIYFSRPPGWPDSRVPSQTEFLDAGICQALDISEHELITASEDFKQAELEQQARGFQNIVKTYSWIFYISYAVSLIACFICNLALQHTVSWFFIVLTAELTAFSLLNVPVLVSKNKDMATLGSFFLSLTLLLLTCCLYTGGNWFGITFLSLLFGFSVVFCPFVLAACPLPDSLRNHKALLSLGIDTVLLFLLVGYACFYNGYIALLLSQAIPITFVGILLPWIFLLLIRYLKCNGFFKASLCLLAAGLYVYVINNVINTLLDHTPFHLPVFDLTNWSSAYLNGNITFLLLLSCLAGAFLFAAGGIALTLRKEKKQNI